MNLNTEQYFSLVPNIDAPRSVFDRSFTYKTTMDVNYLYPIFIDEALPGDNFKMDFQVFGRLANPLVVPIMDELYFETLWFQVDNHLLWSNFYRFCGEQDNPDDSVDYVIPTINSGDSGFAPLSIADYFGIPVNVANLTVNALPFRAYNLVYNTWFRDENLISSVTVPTGDSDSASNYTLLKSAKMHDFFTSCLPFSQKGDPVTLPLFGSAPIAPLTSGTLNFKGQNVNDSTSVTTSHDLLVHKGTVTSHNANGNLVYWQGDSELTSGETARLVYNSGLSVDLSGVTPASIDDFVFAMKLQQKRTRDAIGGTRYVEWVRSHFSVESSDARFTRPVFLGSTREMIDINTIVQTSSSDSTSPQGNLTATGVVSHHGAGFDCSFTEHGYLLGIARIRHNPVYQQGLNRMWTRSTLLDFYLPVFNGIAEQPVRNDEIFAQGGSVVDTDGVAIDSKAFGFNEAWAQYRYKPSMITGLLRSGVTGSLDVFHLAEDFNTLPLLNQSFIEEDIPLDRALSVYKTQQNPNIIQFIFDFRFNYTCARPMPVHNIPDTLSTHF